MFHSESTGSRSVPVARHTSRKAGLLLRQTGTLKTYKNLQYMERYSSASIAYHGLLV